MSYKSAISCNKVHHHHFYHRHGNNKKFQALKSNSDNKRKGSSSATNYIAAGPRTRILLSVWIFGLNLFQILQETWFFSWNIIRSTTKYIFIPLRLIFENVPMAFDHKKLFTALMSPQVTSSLHSVPSSQKHIQAGYVC